MAYVEFRVGRANRSEAIKDQLRALGARVREKLTSDVTHVVFKDGNLVCQICSQYDVVKKDVYVAISYMPVQGWGQFIFISSILIQCKMPVSQFQFSSEKVNVQFSFSNAIPCFCWHTRKSHYLFSIWATANNLQADVIIC